MSALELSEQHQFIVLASDGLWDLVAPEDLPDIFYRFDWEDAVSPSRTPHTFFFGISLLPTAFLNMCPR